MSSSRRHRLQVPENLKTDRLDKWLATLEFIPSRSRASELIDSGLVRRGQKTLKPSTKIFAGDWIEIEIPEQESSVLKPLDAPLTILHEDEDLIVVNKPNGLVVHPAAGHAQDTLVNILLFKVRNLSMGFAENRPGIVHRLDRDTSGILVVAKNDFAHLQLAEQFRKKTTHRIYWAIVYGIPSPAKQTVKSYLGRHPTDRKRFASQENQKGKLAITHFEVMKTSPQGLSWVKCRLETGRTHQIRVHLSEAGWPIVGDPLYGSKSVRRIKNINTFSAINELKRMALHACELGFVHPRSGKTMTFRIDWPPELQEFVKKVSLENV